MKDKMQVLFNESIKDYPKLIINTCMPYVYRKLPASLERREKIYMLRNNDIEICNKWHQKKHIGKNQFAAIFFFRQGH